MHRIIVLFILSLFSCFVISQNVPLLPECTTFDKSAAPASGEICSPYLSPQIWLPISGATTLIDTYLNETLLWQVKAAESVMPASCYDSLLSLLCNGAFPPCMVINDLAVANFSCRSTCEHVNNYLCINFFGFFLGEEDKINCSMTDYITGEDQFPVEYHLNTNLFKTNYVNTTCVPPDRLPTTAARELLPCPYPLGRVPSPINPIEPPCNAPCPDFVWTLSQYKALGTIEFTFAFISFILMIFLSLHYLLDPKCRQTTKRFQLYAFLSQAGFAFAFVVAGPDPLTTTWCRSGTDFATWDNNARCGTQAFFFVVFGLSAAIYWAISSYLMFITLENPKFVLKRRFELLSHIAGIGIPLSLLGVAIHKKIVTFYWITPMCFIQTQITKGDNGLNYQYALFYIPMCVPILIAIIFVALTMVRIIKHMRSMRQTFKDQSTTGISIVQVNIRLFIWCASLFLFFTTIVVYRAGVESIWRSLRTDAEDWGICKVLVELGLGSGEKCPEDTYPRPLNYAGTVIHYIVTTTLGTFSFFAFGTSTIIYHFWYFLFKSIYERKWDQVVSLVTNQKTYTAMRNSHLRASRAMLKQDNSTNRSSVMLSSASAQNLNKGTSTTASASASASISAVELTDRSESIHSSSD